MGLEREKGTNLNDSTPTVHSALSAPSYDVNDTSTSVINKNITALSGKKLNIWHMIMIRSKSVILTFWTNFCRLN